MDPDKYQQAWQVQSAQSRVTIDANLLLKEVQHTQRHFRATIFWRDFREIGVALLMIPLWLYLGARFALPWSWYLTVPALVWIAGFIQVDRMRHQKQPGEPGEPLLHSVQESLAQVSHQIWLLRNVFWWYLLPCTISVLAFFAHVAWLESRDLWGFLGPVLFVTVLYVGIYYLNQYAVRSQLEPRRQELLALLASLKDETNSDDENSQHAMTKSSTGVKSSEKLWRAVSIMALLVVLTALASVAAFFAGQAAAGYPKLSPFAAVRWQESRPEVELGDEWWQLVSIDDVPATEIVAFSQRTYGDLWRKRFEEDLVEVLAGMGHEPKKTVRLVVSPFGSSNTRTLEDVPMTKANRQAIKAAAQTRPNPESQPEQER
jgi:hypothetical protein